MLAKQRGIILPLIAVALIALVGLVALAVDIGRLVVAQTQCQNAADSAAIAGSRSLDGAQDLPAATADATNAATSGNVLGASILSSEVSVSHGAYHYDSSAETFTPQIPAQLPDNYNLTQVTITHVVNTTFGHVLGKSSSTVVATATAAHRPRDVVIILDYSGSMNNESDLWNNESYFGSVNNSPNNTDPVFPQWGPYKPSFSANAALQCTSSDSRVGMCNITQSVLGIPAMVNDFYQNNFGSSGVSSFASAGSTTSAPTSGDNYFAQSGTPILSWGDLTGTNAPSSKFFPATTVYPSFKGYAQGPKYWGKTFFTWPPNPSATSPPAWGTTWDWRKLYFKSSSGATITSDLQLWSSGGAWLDPPGNYQINYKAILAWIKSSPCPFPSQLRAGNVLYYSAIPTDVPAAAYTWTNANNAIANQDQRFWKEYIDYMVGVWRDPEGDVIHPGTPACSYGPDFAAGSGRTPTISGPDSVFKVGYQAFVNPTDNPTRPRHRLWFGPMTMVQFMSDTGILPGTTHDISLVASKLGVAGALQDIQINHPNDLVSMIMFCRAPYSGEPAEVGRFGKPQVSMSNDYTALINGLWYPPNSGSGDVRPWDSNGLRTPAAHGDYDANTATDYGLMLAYNQFSANSSLASAGMGGLGRKGAQKMVIFETDGMANQASSQPFTSAGAYKSYYTIGAMGSSSSSGGDAATAAENVATTICALDTDSPPGFAQPQRPVQIHCIAFGAIFEPTASGSEQAYAISFLQELSSIGGTNFPSSAGDPNDGYKWCIGTLSQRQAKLQQAFTKILDETESIILVK